MFSIYTDGASRSNPGKSASGYNVYDSNGRLLIEKVFYNGIATNNVAEYLAIVTALKDVSVKFGYDNDLLVYSDSSVIINQLNGSYKTKDAKLKKLNSSALSLLRRFKSYKLNNVRREDRNIAKVDRELNILLDSLDD